MSRARPPRRARRGATAAAALLASALAATGCGPAAGPAADGPFMDGVAESYVRLVLGLGRHDEDYVDAYLGPAEWRSEAAAAALPLNELAARSRSLAAELAARPEPAPEMDRLRFRHLAASLRSLVARIEMLEGRRLTFDEESAALYDAVAPRHGAGHYQAVLDRLDARLGGEGSLVERFEAFRHDFIVPPERLETVFAAAIEACRERTLRHLELPDGESFEVEYVREKPWSAYNWYQGGYRSLIQVNTDLPIHIDRALDLACHEGYPGHHVFSLLAERDLVEERGWMEFAVYPLFSPRSLIAEGTANYGVQMAFPGVERVEFERRVLFPLAGLDVDRAAEYYEIYGLAKDLGYAGNEAARDYLDGRMEAAAALDWLTTYALMPPARAEQRLRFIERYRSYVINYNLGQELVRGWIDRRGGADDDPAALWREFAALLTTPTLPSALAEG